MDLIRELEAEIKCHRAELHHLKKDPTVPSHEYHVSKLEQCIAVLEQRIAKLKQGGG